VPPTSPTPSTHTAQPHLPQGGSGNGLVLKRAEHFPNGPPQAVLHDLFGGLCVEGGHVVLHIRETIVWCELEIMRACVTWCCASCFWQPVRKRGERCPAEQQATSFGASVRSCVLCALV